jgi:hypothetical protein
LQGLAYFLEDGKSAVSPKVLIRLILMAVDFTARDWMEGMTMSLFSLKDTTKGHTVQYSSRLLASDKVFNKFSTK